MVQRPPLEPSNLTSQVEENGVSNSAEDGTIAKGKVEDDNSAYPKCGGYVGDITGGASRSAELGTFAKDKRIVAIMEDRAMLVENAVVMVGGRATKMKSSGRVGVVDDGTGNSAEVSASVREKWSLSWAAGSTTFMTAKGWVVLRNEEAHFCRVSPIVVKPPPVIKAVFPWDRSEEAVTMNEHEGIAVTDAAWTAGSTRRELPGTVQYFHRGTCCQGW
ncbi:hypothetical protein PIB30_049201 [Stylosanthes scabra]|uniref:Uncharacterized protein n=1 Tax=Stylosanthes scabra TaxID=79078 RepID=A0ABU6WKN0_9FABA|nr:hypothetical protein [Stylosanthes scabra]